MDKNSVRLLDARDWLSRRLAVNSGSSRKCLIAISIAVFISALGVRFLHWQDRHVEIVSGKSSLGGVFNRYEKEAPRILDEGGILFPPDGIERDQKRFALGLEVIRSHPAWFLGVMLRRDEFMLSYNDSRPHDWPEIRPPLFGLLNFLQGSIMRGCSCSGCFGPAVFDVDDEDEPPENP